MSYQFYHLIHLVSLVFMLCSLAGAYFVSANGISKTENSARRIILILHGLGWLGLFVSGFGLIARLGLHSFPVWIFVKLGVLFFLGYAVAPLQKDSFKIIGPVSLFLVIVAVAMVVLKPW